MPKSGLQQHLEFFAELGVTHLQVEQDLGTKPAPEPAAKPVEAAQAHETAAAEPPVVVAPSWLSLEEIRSELGDCQRCKLHSTRRQIVFGVGSPNADLMFVGEAPGADEDAQGVPFVGRAGQLLTRIIEAIGLRREDVYIANILKCRPPQNRNPEDDEVKSCHPFLLRQIESVKPMIIVTLGKYASQTLLKSTVAISRLRGNFHDYHGTRLMPTFHPSYLLRNRSAKIDVWKDVQKVRETLKQLGSVYYK